MKFKIDWQRVLKMTAFSLLFVFLLTELGLAWVYVDAFVAPGCPQPAPIAGYPLPMEEQVETADGLVLDVWVYPSQNGALVIALGGLHGSLAGGLPPVEYLLEAGYGLVLVESRACAQPVGPVTLGYREGEDVGPIMQNILHNNYGEAGRIGITGFSMGGAAAIQAAADNPEIAAVVAEGGYWNLGEHMLATGTNLWEKLLRWTVAGVFWARTGVNPWQSSPIDDLPRISPRPVLLIYGEHEVDSGGGMAQYEAAGEPKEIWVVPGGDHGTNYRLAQEEYEARVLAFFGAWLLDN